MRRDGELDFANRRSLSQVKRSRLRPLPTALAVFAITDYSVVRSTAEAAYQFDQIVGTFTFP